MFHTIKLLLVTAGSLVAFWLIAIGIWHLIYKLIGVPKLRGYETYRGRLFFRASMSFLTLAFAFSAFFAVSVAGAKITSKSTTAKVTVTPDTIHRGDFIRIQRDDLPKKSRGGISRKDVLFLEKTPHYGKRAVFIAIDNKDEFRKISKFNLYKRWYIEREPAAPFRWLGPELSHWDLIIDQSGGKMLTSHLRIWTTISS